MTPSQEPLFIETYDLALLNTQMPTPFMKRFCILCIFTCDSGKDGKMRKDINTLATETRRDFEHLKNSA